MKQKWIFFFFWKSHAFSMIQQMLAIWSPFPWPLNQLYKHTRCFLDYFPIQIITEYRVVSPLLYSMMLLVIYLIYSNGNPLQYSCLDNPKDRGDWWATVHRVTKRRTQLKWLSMHIPCISLLPFMSGFAVYLGWAETKLYTLFALL